MLHNATFLVFVTLSESISINLTFVLIQRSIRAQLHRCAALLDMISKIVDLSIVLSFLFVNKNVRTGDTEVAEVPVLLFFY